MRLLSIVPLLLFHGLVGAQVLSWSRITPDPIGYALTGLDMIDQQTGWGLTDGGHLLHTTDGGLTWTPQNLAGWFRAGSLQFMGADSGWIALNGGDLLRTLNGGLTWNEIPTGLVGFSTDVPAMHFVDHLHGWMVLRGGQVVATTDGGATWVPQVSNTTSQLTGVHFIDLLTGCAVGFNGAVIRTEDGGQTWTVVNSGTSSWIRSVRWADAQHVWAVTTGNGVLHSADAGLTWAPVGLSTSGTFERFHFRSPQEGYLLTGSAEAGMLRTTDGGSTWTPVSTGPVPVSFLEFTDEQHAVAGGGCSRMGYSTDGGGTWTGVSEGPVSTWLDMQFVNGTTGHACGNGTILRTTDGGLTWSALNVPPLNFDAVHFITPLEGWAGGRNNGLAPALLLHTADGGGSWDTVPLPTTNYVYDVWFTDPLHGWVCSTSNGLICRTTDGGATWTCVDPNLGNASVMRVQFVDTLRGWVSGAGGQRYWTDDGGGTWNPAPATSGAHSFWGLAFRDSLVGLVCGDSTILRTADGGLTWDPVNTISPWPGGNLRTLTWAGADEVWCSGGLGVPVLHSTDAGQTWEIEDPGFLSIWSLAWNGQAVFAGGACGSIARLDPLSVSVSEAPVAMGAPFPNPCDGRAFRLPATGNDAEVRVFDGAGRLRARQRVLADAGAYPVVLAQPLEPGAYAVSLHEGDRHVQRWIVVVTH